MPAMRKGGEMGRILCRKAWTFVSKKPAKRLRFLGIVLTLALIVSLLPTAVLAEDEPPTTPPHQFYGTVTITDPSGTVIGPAGDGLIVSAWIDGEEKASCVTTAAGTIGGAPCEGCYGLVAGGTLKVPGEAGDVVDFFVQGVKADRTYEWELGGFTRLDLIVAWGEFGVPGLLSPADGSCIKDDRPEFRWTPVSDPSGVTYDLQVDDDDGFTSLVIDETGLASPFYTPGGPLPDGTYYWRVKAVSGDLKESSWAGPWSLQVDTVAPAATIVPLVPDPTDDNTPTFTGTATDIGCGVASVEYRVDGGAWLLPEPVDGAFDSGVEEYTFTTDPLVDGGHTVEVRATDAVGNTGAADSDEFTVDATPPLISDVEARDITASSAVISWTTSEPATSQVEYGETEDYGEASDKSTELTTEHRVEITGLKFRTEYHFRVKSADDVGNEAVSGDETFTTPVPIWLYAVVGVGALIILAIVLAVVVWIVRRFLR